MTYRAKVALVVFLCLGIVVAGGLSFVFLVLLSEEAGDAAPSVQLQRFRSGYCISLSAVDFSPDGKRVAIGAQLVDRLSIGGKGGVLILRTKDLEIEQLLDIKYRAFAIVFCDQDSIATDNFDGEDEQLRLWSLRGGRMIHSWHMKGSVHELSTSREKGVLAAAIGGPEDDRGVRAWKLSDKSVVFEDKVGTFGALSVAISPKGKYVAAGNTAGVKVWDLATGKQVHSLAHERCIWLKFSANEELLAAAGNDNAEKWRRKWAVWNMASGMREEHQGMGPSVAVDFSPDGRLIAFGRDKEVIVWDREERKQRLAFADEPIRLAFAPDGKTFCTIRDGTVSLWEVATGKKRSRDLNK